jgi:hypothetical protein
MAARSIPSPTVVLGISLAFVLACAGCGTRAVTIPRVEKRSFDAHAQVRVLVSTFNGAIDVASGDVGRVDVMATVRGWGSNERAAEDELANIDLTVDQQDDTIRVTARRTRLSTAADRSGVDVKLVVPPETFARLSTTNAPVTARGISGGLTVETSNGPITARECSGEARLMTSRQPIEVEMQDARIEADTSNAAIRFRGSLAAGAQLFTTSNGRIEITLPSDAGFVLHGRTTHGKVASQFPIEPPPHNTAREVRGSTARPGGKQPATIITAETSNSEILIHRAAPEAAGSGQ